jgi:hypothetical protein
MASSGSLGMTATSESTLKSIFGDTVPVPCARDTAPKEILFPFLGPRYKKSAPLVTTPSSLGGTTVTTREFTRTTT